MPLCGIISASNIVDTTIMAVHLSWSTHERRRRSTNHGAQNGCSIHNVAKYLQCRGRPLVSLLPSMETSSNHSLHQTSFFSVHIDGAKEPRRPEPRGRGVRPSASRITQKCWLCFDVHSRSKNLESFLVHHKQCRV